jgi:hypothetical protein
LTTEGLKSRIMHLSKHSGTPFSANDAQRRTTTQAIGSGMHALAAQAEGGWSSLAMLENYTAILGPDDVRRFLEAN